MPESVYGVRVDAQTNAGARQVARDFTRMEIAARQASGANKQLGSSFTASGQSMKRMAMQMAGPLGLTASVAGLSAALVSATRKSLRFEKQMAEISTLLPKDSKAVAVLSTAIKELSAEYAAIPLDTAKATYQIISAGATSAAEATEILTAANKLAVGGVTDVATAADGLTTILNAYGLTGREATDVSDQLFVAMRAGKTNVGELSQSISYVAAAAAQTNIPLSEVLAAVAALTKGGVPTQRAMRGLAQVIANTVKPTSEAATEAERLGLQFSAMALQAQGLKGFLDSVKEATDGDTAAIARLFGGVESMLPVLTLTGKGAEDFTTILEDMDDAAGQTAEAVGKITSTDAFKLDKARADWELFTQEVGGLIVTNMLGPLARVYHELAKIREEEEKYQSRSAAQKTPEELALSGTEQAHANFTRFMVQFARQAERIYDVEAFGRMADSLEREGQRWTEEAGAARLGPTVTPAAPADADIEAWETPENLRLKAEADFYRQKVWGQIDASDAATMSGLAGTDGMGLSGPGGISFEEGMAVLGRSIAETLRQEAFANIDQRSDLRILSDDPYAGIDADVAKDAEEFSDALASMQDDLVAAEKAASHAGVMFDDLAEPTLTFAEKLSEVENELYQLAGVLDRVIPGFGQFTDAAIKLGKGDVFGAAVSGMHGLLDVFGVAKDKTDELARSMERAAAAAEEQTRANARIARGISGDYFDAAESALLDPILDVFGQIRASQDLDWFVREFGEHGAAMAQAEAVRLTRRTVGIDYQGSFSEALAEAGFDRATWDQLVTDIFGTSDTVELATLAFGRLSESIESASSAAAKLANMELNLTISGLEMGIRQRAAEAFREAGGDVIKQREAWDAMQSEIAAVRSMSTASGIAAKRVAPDTGYGPTTDSPPGQGYDRPEIDPAELEPSDFVVLPDASAFSAMYEDGLLQAMWGEPGASISDYLEQFMLNVRAERKTITASDLVTLPQAADFTRMYAVTDTGLLDSMWGEPGDSISDMLTQFMINVRAHRKNIVAGDLVTIPQAADFTRMYAATGTGLLSSMWGEPGDSISDMLTQFMINVRAHRKNIVASDLVTIPQAADFTRMYAATGTGLLSSMWGEPGDSISDMLTQFMINVRAHRKAITASDLVTLPQAADFTRIYSAQGTGLLHSMWGAPIGISDLLEQFMRNVRSERKTIVPDDLLKLPTAAQFSSIYSAQGTGLLHSMWGAPLGISDFLEQHIANIHSERDSRPLRAYDFLKLPTAAEFSSMYSAQETGLLAAMWGTPGGDPHAFLLQHIANIHNERDSRPLQASDFVKMPTAADFTAVDVPISSVVSFTPVQLDSWWEMIKMPTTPMVIDLNALREGWAGHSLFQIIPASVTWSDLFSVNGDFTDFIARQVNTAVANRQTGEFRSY